MTSWLPMMTAGIVAVAGGLLALANPTSAGVTTAALAGWALIVAAALLGWSAWRAETTGARIRAGLIGAAALPLGVSLLLGPFGDGSLTRVAIGLILIASAAAKLWAGGTMTGSENKPLMLGAGGASALLGLTALLGLNLNFGVLLGVELLASGLALILLAMHRRTSV